MSRVGIPRAGAARARAAERRFPHRQPECGRRRDRHHAAGRFVAGAHHGVARGLAAARPLTPRVGADPDRRAARPVVGCGAGGGRTARCWHRGAACRPSRSSQRRGEPDDRRAPPARLAGRAPRPPGAARTDADRGHHDGDQQPAGGRAGRRRRRRPGFRRGPRRPPRPPTPSGRHRHPRRGRGARASLGCPFQSPGHRHDSRRDAARRTGARFGHPHGARAGARGAADAPAALELSSTAAVRSAVAAGAGPAAVGDYAIKDDLATGRLVRINVAGLDLTRRLHAVWRGGAHPPEGPARDLVTWAAGQSGAGKSRN